MAGRAVRWAAWGAVAGPVQFTVTWSVLGWMSEGYPLWGHWIEYSPVSQPISGLGLGATAGAMNSSFVALGLLLVVGSFGICSALRQLTVRRRRACATILGLPGVGAIVVGLFNLESMLMHAAGFGLVISTVVGFPVMGRLLRQVPEWRSWGRALMAAGPVALVLAVWYFAAFDPIAAGRGEGVAGLSQRVLVSWILAWYVGLGWRVAVGPVASSTRVVRPGAGARP